MTNEKALRIAIYGLQDKGLKDSEIHAIVEGILKGAKSDAK
jgi:hypothetical protein